MNTEQQKAVSEAAGMFNGSQRLLDREYEDRMRGATPRFPRFYNTVEVDYKTQQADKKLGTILTEFSDEQFAEYLRMTTTDTEEE